jgi:hypothetical protein
VATLTRFGLNDIALEVFVLFDFELKSKSGTLVATLTRLGLNDIALEVFVLFDFELKSKSGT